MQDILLFAQQHAALSTALAIALILLIILELIKSKKGARQLSPALATQMINHEDAVVVDVRNTEAFNTGHLTAALSIPFTEFENNIKKLDKFKTQPILIVCATGQESIRAANVLIKNNFKPFVLAGGIRGWKDADMPLVKG